MSDQYVQVVLWVGIALVVILMKPWSLVRASWIIPGTTTWGFLEKHWKKPIRFVILFPILLFGYDVWCWFYRYASEFHAFTNASAATTIPEVTAQKKTEEQARTIQWNGAVHEPFGPIVEAEIPASTEPAWAFVGVLPPKTGETKVRAVLHGIVPEDYQAYLVEGGLIDSPTSLVNLESQVVVGPGKFTPVVRLGRLPYQSIMGSNQGLDLSVLYLQSNLTGTAQQIDVSFEMPQQSKIEQWSVKIGRNEVNISLPTTGFNHFWVVPIRDDAHLSRLQGMIVDAEGTDEELLKQALCAHLKSKNIPPVDKHVTQTAKENMAVRPNQNLNYQALVIEIDGKQTNLNRHKVFTAEQIARKTIKLRLNAGEDELVNMCQPAKILVGWQKDKQDHLNLLGSRR